MSETGDDASPGILDTETEQEILYQRLVDYVERGLGNAMRPGLTVSDGAGAIAAMAVTGVLWRLRVMSGRQLAVVLAGEANRGEGWTVQEPPRYTAEETGDVS